MAHTYLPPITEKAAEFFASNNRNNIAKAIMAHSANSTQANDTFRRRGYTLQLRKRYLATYVKYLNNQAMTGIPKSPEPGFENKSYLEELNHVEKRSLEEFIGMVPDVEFPPAVSTDFIYIYNNVNGNPAEWKPTRVDFTNFTMTVPVNATTTRYFGGYIRPRANPDVPTSPAVGAKLASVVSSNPAVAVVTKAIVGGRDFEWHTVSEGTADITYTADDGRSSVIHVTVAKP